jgi:hypothetical protein
VWAKISAILVKKRYMYKFLKTYGFTWNVEGKIGDDEPEWTTVVEVLKNKYDKPLDIVPVMLNTNQPIYIYIT